jgi:hypothetical protein
MKFSFAVFALAAAFAAASAPIAAAAPVPFPLNTTVVRLDGVPIGSPLHPTTLNSLRNTVAFNPADGLYHLWVLNGGDTTTPADMQVADITYATSADGFTFTSQGKLNPPANWWTQIPGVGATNEPSVNFLRVDKIGAEWFLTIWSPNEANTGLYNYNANVWNIGPAIGNLNIVQRGPLPSLSEVPTGPGGNMVGSFGMVGGNIYLRQDTQFNSGAPVNPLLWGGGMGRYVYTDGTRPTLSPVWGTSEADLFTGTPYCWVLPFGGPNQCLAFPLLKPSYVHNSGRTLQQSGGIVGAYYTFRDAATAARQEKQIYYVESADGGLTWTGAAGVYANGNAVLVDGLPNSANFSSPEVVVTPTGYRSYFSTADACGNIVAVTDENPLSLRGPQIVKTFGAPTVPAGGSTTLTVTLSAPVAACVPAPVGALFTNAGFTDTLPAGVVLDNPPIVSNTCGGTLTAIAGAGTFGLSGAGIAAGQTCAVVVNVKALTLGSKPNVIPRVGGGAATPGFYNDQTAAALADAAATLTVGAAAANAVPTVSRTVLATLAALLLAVAAFRLRRRR